MPVMGGCQCGFCKGFTVWAHMERLIFQRLYLSDMQDSSVTNTDLLPLGLELAMQCLVLCLHGLYWDDVQEL